ncbi:hypothetical protein ISCGN_006639, partial [Ixodes scapularis]
GPSKESSFPRTQEGPCSPHAAGVATAPAGCTPGSPRAADAAGACPGPPAGHHGTPAARHVRPDGHHGGRSGRRLCCGSYDRPRPDGRRWRWRGGGCCPAPVQQQPQQQQQLSGACQYELKQFLECAQNQHDISLCEGFNQVLKECRLQNGI